MSTTELAWLKSSYSGTDGDNCVEVAAAPCAVHVRDSKCKHGPQLAIDPVVWSAFIDYASER
ncbi:MULTISPECIES: DUF397 domain-containing protein [Streptomyces]|uniref:DUF397 domain-containing protein n=1 Tax=Streptomyces TaxID=1883 RepID=UPI001601B11A|nr:DUF397 domain-containing protein [Streptomyces murinus]MBA9049222.1 hypothetical protein [Streptomyces murinus]